MMAALIGRQSAEDLRNMFSSNLTLKGGTYSVAVHQSATPYLYVYNVNPADIGTGTTFTRLANPAVLPITSGYGQGVNWSPDGTFLAFSSTVSPYIAFYVRDGDILTKLTAVDRAVGVNPNSTRGGGWHPNGKYYTQGADGLPNVSTWERTDQTFTLLSSGTNIYSSLPASRTWSAVYNPQGNILTLGMVASPRITNYWFDGTKFTKLANPGTLPTGQSQSQTWNRDGTVLVLGHASAPFITAYWVNYAGTDTTFTKLANPITNPGSEVVALSFNNTSSSIICATGGSPYLCCYNVNYAGTATTLTKTPAMPSNGLVGYGIRFLADDNSIIAMRYTSPWINFYTRSGDTFTMGNRPSPAPNSDANGPISIWPASGGLF